MDMIKIAPIKATIKYDDLDKLDIRVGGRKIRRNAV